MNVNDWYGPVLADIITGGAREVNKRTGVECAAIPGLTFQTDLEREGLPVVALRKIPVKNFVAEQCWFLSGSSDVKALEPYTKIWSSFAEENGEVTSAYGHRWRNYVSGQEEVSEGKFAPWKIDQLDIVLKKLKEDPTSRHGVVLMWEPGMDLVVPQKNVPCPYTFTLMVIGGRLHMHLTVRSNDMVLGFPTDAAGFAFLQSVLAHELGLRPGVYTHSISNAHVYANHYEAGATMANRYSEKRAEHFDIPTPVWPKIRLEMPDLAYARAMAMDPTFIAACVDRIQSSYEPMPAIGGLTIAL